MLRIRTGKKSSIRFRFHAYTVHMGKLLGFMLFFIGVGMVLGILITENFIVIAMAVICLLCGYHMFCR